MRPGSSLQLGLLSGLMGLGAGPRGAAPAAAEEVALSDCDARLRSAPDDADAYDCYTRVARARDELVTAVADARAV